MKTLKILGITCLAFILSTAGCTKLDEEVLGSKYVNPEGSAGAADLAGVYAQLNPISNEDNVFSLMEHTSDEMMGPTRGTDWDDFGKWRKLHQHTWDGVVEAVNNAWEILNIGVFRATQVIEGASDNQIKAEASFLRAYYMYYVLDLYGQTPFRDPTSSPDADPQVFSRREATEFVIKDLEFAEANLASGPAGKATKEAAQFLLAKLYLNKAVYFQDPETPAGPFTFEKADLDKAITYANSIILSGKYQLQPRGTYFNNFKWDNTTASTELIFVIPNDEGNQPANVNRRTHMTIHYNQTPGSWNGFTTLADFYNSFEESDERRGQALPGFTDRVGTRAGFLVGQQFDSVGQPLKDRSGNPLIFTPDVDLFFSTELKGIRVLKYPLNPDRLENSENDYVLFRFADVVLMKAEAIHRGGTDPLGQNALSLVNGLRTLRGASQLAALDDATLLAERGRELYWEGWRRQDQVRFGTFNNPVDQRPTASPGTRVVFPIPQRALDTNPNLHQNPGY